MRIGIRPSLSTVVLACVVISAVSVHLLWRRTADANSRALAERLNQQIASAVKGELAARITSAEAAYGAVRTIFVQSVIETREADKRQFVFLSQIQAQPTLSWAAFGWPDGSFFATHRLSDTHLEMMEIDAAVDKHERIVDLYRFIPGDIEYEQRNKEKTDYNVTRQAWYQDAIAAEGPRWSEVTAHPTYKRAAITYAGPIDIYTKRQGALAVMIEYDRLARFLASQAAAAFILAPDGHIIAGPDAKADAEHGMDLTSHPLFAIAAKAGVELAKRTNASGEGAPKAPGDGGAEGRLTMADLRLSDHDVAYAVAITPLGLSASVDARPPPFRDWHVVVIIPEVEFLGEIAKTTMRLSIGLLVLVIAAGLVSSFIASRLIAEPIRAVVGDLEAVENFDLDHVVYRPSRLKELHALSSALVRMKAGLSAFGKYLPTDLVRALVAQGVEAKPGGAMRPLTILFADVAGFTGLSERLGDKIVPLIGRYLDAASRAVHEQKGTVDKFIGDAVMAFWGAPHDNPNHAGDACRGALEMQRAIVETGLTDDAGLPLRVRIGLNSGTVLVGNIGSERRLNYTVIGDAVNVASRLEGINKIYGTSILVGEETRRLAGDAIVVREVDRIAVAGRMQGLAVYELLAMADEAEAPAWTAIYASALAAYRARRWGEAKDLFEKVIGLRGDDGPSRRMAAACATLIAKPPGVDWQAVTVMDSK